MDASDEPYVDAVQAEFAGSQNRRAVAAVLLAHETLHETIVNEIGDHLLKTLQASYEDFEVVDAESLYDPLSLKQQPWQLRRSSWPVNLSIALEADQRFLNKVFFGVHAPNPKDAGIRAEKIGCSVPPVIDRAVKVFGGGHATVGWSWWAWCITVYWSPEYAAQVVLHSPTSKVGDHPEIAELTERMMAFAEAIEAEIQKG